MARGLSILLLCLVCLSDPFAMDLPFCRKVLDSAGGQRFIRFAPPAYLDGISTPSRANLRSAREISNIIHAADGSDERRLITTKGKIPSALLAYVGQLIDHDLDLTLEGKEAFDIPIPAGDKFFDPSKSMSFFRSLFDPQSGSGANNPREQLSFISPRIDASLIYGEPDRAYYLRANDGSGKLLIEKDRLPLNRWNLPNDPTSSPMFYVAGDRRANENIALTSLHLIFAREHNFWADNFKKKNAEWSDEKIFQNARRMVTAEWQLLIFEHFLPILLGRNSPSLQPASDKTSSPIPIWNEFATLGFRFGHSMIPEVIQIPETSIPLKNAFFNPTAHRILGPDPLVVGLSRQTWAPLDGFVTDSLRNFLFGDPRHGGFDLYARNIQRGRDHGIPDYNSLRRALGLAKKEKFEDITSNSSLARAISIAYEGNLSAIDPYVAGLSEDALGDGHLGELFSRILVIQFEAMRDGDPNWVTRLFSPEEINQLRARDFAQILRQNTNLNPEDISDQPFVIP